jgi:hypothetical protein
VIDLGTVRPGSTLRIPFSSFDKDDGSSVTMTNFAVADMLVYKDGGTTERASTAGFTATTDFDAKTGKHLAIIDLADNTTAGFYAAGSEYLVAIDAVTVDAVTTGGWIARFRIGYPTAIFDTTIATLASQTSFTLTVGPAEDDALNDQWCIIHDVASAVQSGKAIISDYTGSTKTVTLAAGTTFTAAATDNISIMGPMPMQPTVAARKLDVSTGGEAGVDWANVGSPTTALNLSGTNIDPDQVVASVTGAVGSVAAGGITAASFAANAINASKLDPDVTTELQAGLATAAALDTVDNFLDTEVAAILAAVDTEVGAIITTLGTPAGVSVSADIAAVKAQTAAIETDTAEIGAAGAGLTVLATQASVNTIDDFLDTEVAAILADTNELQTDWADGGRLDLILDAAGSAGDPWSTAIPGAYGAGTAGKIVGDNLNATVSSRASQTSLDVVDDLLDTEVAAIKSDTAAILIDTAEIGAAGAGLTALASQASVNTIDDLLDTEVAAIKTVVDAIKLQTDGLPSGIQKNAALNNFEFLMVLASDHVTAATGLAVTAQRSIDGAAFAACANSVAEVGSGVYKIDFAATDMNGDIITFLFTAATADARVITIATEP